MSLITSLKKFVMKFDPMRYFDKLEKKMIQNPNSFKASPFSPERFDILRNIIKDKDASNVIDFGRNESIFFGTIFGVRKSFTDLKRNPKKPKTEASKEFIELLENKAKELGIHQIGYAKISSDTVFKNKAILFENAVVLTMEMDKTEIDKAPSKQTRDEVFRVYRDLGVVTIKLSNFLRQNGFSAHAGHPLGGLSLYPKIGQLAGLGWHGKHGLLISPEVGPRQRVAVVYTSIENLPFATENKHFWIEDFCKTCGRCVKMCPPGAIYQKTIVHDNGVITSIDNEKCFPEFSRNHGCTVCIKECTFNNFDFIQRKKSFEKTL